MKPADPVINARGIPVHPSYQDIRRQPYWPAGAVHKMTEGRVISAPGRHFAGLVDGFDAPVR